MEWIVALSIFGFGLIGSLGHFYVKTTAKKEAELLIQEHAMNCPVSKELKIFINIFAKSLEELNKDVRQIRDCVIEYIKKED